MKRFGFGKFLPLNSYMHTLDPRAKLVSVILLVISVFIPSSFYPFILIASLSI